MDKEQGRAGLNRWGGHISEEWLPELSGMRGIRVYQEMADNDATVGAILFAIKMLIRQASWSVQPAGTEKKDIEAAEFVESCLHDMQDTWTNTISEILSFLPFGWSLHELCYKRRMGHKKNPLLDSKHDDGLIGWLKLPIRCQESLYEWEFDESDNLTAFIQMPAPDYKIIRIPAEKFILFRTESRKGNPEGRSILRPAYRSWYMKKRIEELEGIGIERNLAGFPVLQAPDGIEIWSSENAGLLQTCNDFVSNIRRDSMEGLTIPFGWELKLLSTGDTLSIANSDGNFSGVVSSAETSTFAPSKLYFKYTQPDPYAAYAEYLVVHMPFTTSVTEDLAGGTWTANGSPTIQDGALYLNGSSYLKKTGGITLGGQDFTICGWFNVAAKGYYRRVYCVQGGEVSEILFNTNGQKLVFRCNSDFSQTMEPVLGTWYHFEISYWHATNQAKAFIDGTLLGTKSATIARKALANLWIGNNAEGYKWNGYIDDFRIYDGIALHTENFTPPARTA